MDWRLLGVQQSRGWDHNATHVQHHKDNTVIAELLFERKLSKATFGLDLKLLKLIKVAKINVLPPIKVAKIID